MLTRNQLLCRIAAGAPMDSLMREFWLPALRSAPLNSEDFVVSKAAGPLAQREREYPGLSDSTVIRFRHLMLAAVRAHRRGESALGLDQKIDCSSIRAVTLRNRPGLDWKEIDPFNPPPSLPLQAEQA